MSEEINPWKALRFACDGLERICMGTADEADSSSIAEKALFAAIGHLGVADLPVDEDAPGSEPQPATTVIVVVEAPVGDLRPVERRYGARGWEDFDDGRLHVFDRKARRVAVYASGAWLSVREDGALVADATKRALDIARHTLNEICRTNVTETNEDGTIHKGVAVLRELARQGLEGIFDEGFE